MASSDLEQWSRFWRQGFITTFGAGKAENYDGAVRAFWVRQFNALPDGARILDIATGNGAIATLAAEVAEAGQKTFFLAATDLAEINPDVKGGARSSRLRKRIQFHSHTPCERQPFDDASFDCVTSQFGFEYADTDATLAEIRRVLDAGGRFLAVSHHADSSLIQRSRDELRVYRFALDELDLFGQFGNYLAAMGDLSDPGDRVALKLRKAKPLSQAFNSAMDTFRNRHAADQCAGEIVGAITQLARGARSVAYETLLNQVADASLEFRLARDRLADMVAAALGADDIGRLERSAHAAGFGAVDAGEFHSEDGRLAGWRIQMQ